MCPEHTVSQVAPAPHGTSSGFPSGGTCPEDLIREASGRHPNCHLNWLLFMWRSSGSILSPFQMAEVLTLSLTESPDSWEENVL